jgi:2-C-methyl-D-erythritol 4-phosphate cytidylyltransferase
MKVLAIILAGGTGSRFKKKTPKQFNKLGSKTIIEHTISAFEYHEKINSIYIVIHKKYYEDICEILDRNDFTKVDRILIGGATRQESSAIGVEAADPAFKKILIHDAARPFISNQCISKVIKKLDDYSAVNIARDLNDTAIMIDPKNVQQITLERDRIKLVQTPQGFRNEIIKNAHRLALKSAKDHFTDDCSLIEEFNLGKIYVVKGEENNIKITSPTDQLIAEKILKSKNRINI